MTDNKPTDPASPAPAPARRRRQPAAPAHDLADQQASPAVEIDPPSVADPVLARLMADLLRDWPTAPDAARRAVIAVVGVLQGAGDAAPADDLPGLNAIALKVRDFLRRQPAERYVKTNEIADFLDRDLGEPRDNSTISRRILPQLRAHGLESIPYKGHRLKNPTCAPLAPRSFNPN